METATQISPGLPTVVIIGGGFGGLYAAKALANQPVQVTLIDRTNHHLFQPLLYQVATAGLSPGEIAQPIRHILKEAQNISVIMGVVEGVDARANVVRTKAKEYPFDFLIIAAGARHSYFGHDEWEMFAPGLKTLPDALELRRRILNAFEIAETAPDERVREAALTFVGDRCRSDWSGDGRRHFGTGKTNSSGRLSADQDGTCAHHFAGCSVEDPSEFHPGSFEFGE